MYSSGKFTIITFEEYISIALDAPRVVGIYPEIKNPVFINEHVSDFSLKSARKNDCAGNYWLLTGHPLGFVLNADKPWGWLH